MIDMINAAIGFILDHPVVLIAIGWLLSLPLVLWLADNAQPNEEWGDEWPDSGTYEDDCKTCDCSDGECGTIRPIDHSPR